ncbi:CCA tRNA nucleotidyltransferase [Thermosulfurimonas marina]|uniref:CCA tRNA nucleotidyltransferase n=1 Tax=Thermosulfurimonas marina TaxID=2047767 RepID=A0A6H1WQ78_9BACT|nr:CCA tRNA nucleotidyltransferase [Thermosulfurimonas marina]QJA05377.1 CCA tRNA nucleotidyltransferase [Thermosulfurimonas marina]
MKDITPAVKPFPFKKLLLATDKAEVLLLAGEIGRALGLSVYLVGGPVRDFFLGRPLKDLDLVVEGDPGPLARRLSRSLRGKLTGPTPFNTYKIRYAGGEVDVALARREVYPAPAALPQVSPAGILEDLSRRDFTANALAVGLSGPWQGKLLDPFEGLADLRAGFLRVLHRNSFVDDPTRIFRGARYAVRFGWRFHRQTSEALGQAYLRESPLLLTPARIRAELARLLSEPSPGQVLGCLEEAGLWLSLELPPPPAAFPRDLLGELSPERALKALILTLTHGNPEKASRLGLSPEEAHRYAEEFTRARSTLSQMPPGLSPSEIFLRLRAFSAEVLVAAAWETGKTALALEHLRQRKIRPFLSGKDLLQEWGLSPGPLVGRLLEALLLARLDGRVKTRDDELNLVHQLLKEAQER